MYKLVVGKISKSRKSNWFSQEENPYGVWDGAALVEEICNVDTWCDAKKFLRDHTTVDWGSFAWKANKAELTEFFSRCHWNTAPLATLEENMDYAVVFIESAGEF